MIRTEINAPFDHVITQDVDTGEVLNLVVDAIGSEVANAVSDDMAAFIAIASMRRCLTICATPKAGTKKTAHGLS
jgi:hypothetical protein